MMTMRSTPLLAALGAMVATLLVLSGCTSQGDPVAESSAAAVGTKYPVTLDSAFGSVTISKKPERVVVLGSSYLDMMSSIGENAVAFTDGAVGSEYFEKLPWMKPKVTSGKLDVTLQSAFEPNLESITLHKPDLVIGHVNNFKQKGMLDHLSKIATMFVPNEKATSGDPWRNTLKSIGRILEKSAQAQSVIDAVGKSFADAKKRLGGLQGKTYNIGMVTTTAVQLLPWTFVSDLGLVPSSTQPTNESKKLSLEEVSQFNGDVSLIYAMNTAARTVLDTNPAFKTLPAVQNQSLIALPELFYGAAGRAAPASLEWILQQVVPALEATPLNKGGK